MTARAPLTALLCTLTLGACGGGDDKTGRAVTPQQQQVQPPPSVPRGLRAIPQDVPLRATRNGDPRAIDVIRRWTDALRGSDVDRAAALWAVPSKVQNGTPVLTLDSAADVRLFNDSLSCGSRLVEARGAKNGFTVAVFRLTDRPGADCGSGTGNTARTAILVRGGRIAEWYRLPDDPDAPAPGAPAPQQPAAPIV